MQWKAQAYLAAFLFIAVFGLNSVLAQSATPLNITSGFNWDLVANGSGSAAGSVTGPFDGYDTSGTNVFYDNTYLSSHSGGNGGVFPAGGTFTGNSGNQYNLAAASGNNSLLLSQDNTSGILNLSYSSPSQLNAIYVLGSSANGSTLLDYTLSFSGGTIVSGSFTYSDWYDPEQTGEVTGLGRVTMGDIYSDKGNSFSLYDNEIVIPAADQSLTLQSISFNYAGDSSETAAIFAVSGVEPVPEPASAALLAFSLAMAGLFARHGGKLHY
jgi:hypothetical protein